MKEFYPQMNKKLYYTVVLIWTAVMMMGLLLDNPRLGGFDLGYILHSIFLLLFYLHVYGFIRGIKIIVLELLLLSQHPLSCIPFSFYIQKLGLPLFFYALFLRFLFYFLIQSCFIFL